MSLEVLIRIGRGKMKKKLQILVCCHKADPYIRTEEPYFPIQVGKALHPDLDLGFQNDNEGDNISKKNPQWCELTALYWGWKNIKDTEFLGLCHYRRYFDCDISDKNIDNILRGKDILLLEREIYSCSIAKSFSSLVTLEDFYIFQDVLLKMHPEYYNAILHYCYNSNMFVRCTMFVARKKIWDDFCNTFFPVFEEVEKIIKKHSYSRLNRSIAYMGELSLGIYVTHKKLRVKYVPQFNESKHSNFVLNYLRRIKKYLIKTKLSLGFYLLNGRCKTMMLYEAVVLGLKNDNIILGMK